MFKTPKTKKLNKTGPKFAWLWEAKKKKYVYIYIYIYSYVIKVIFLLRIKRVGGNNRDCFPT